MEIITVDKDIMVLCKTATSFPDGIVAAHEFIHSLIPFSRERRYFGLSRMEQDSGIVYRAAVEVLEPGEEELYRCETVVIKKGVYASIPIAEFRNNIPAIGQAFEVLLQHPELDRTAYCVEWYTEDDSTVVCMVRLGGENTN